ncbi:hypothetical protein EB796_010976 [Bugula neritina]|uniref:Uncharacterized protein n=1 Tax=Bugula neritina TaxID=10212 RepID=A0A7J7JXU9_BUGNE|nr:hypothetical protein EB796_010976 [Bugula neritina]
MKGLLIYIFQFSNFNNEKPKANLCEQLYSSCKGSGQIMSRSFGGHVEVGVGELQKIIIINSLYLRGLL